jgi:hypothetical protein
MNFPVIFGGKPAMFRAHIRVIKLPLPGREREERVALEESNAAA